MKKSGSWELFVYFLLILCLIILAVICFRDYQSNQQVVGQKFLQEKQLDSLKFQQRLFYKESWSDNPKRLYKSEKPIN